MNMVRKQNGWAWIALTLLTAGLSNPLAHAQTDCGCSQTPAQGYHLQQYGESPCNQGCGSSGTLFSRMRTALRCDSKYRLGLWDGYCDERVACDRTHQPILQGHFGGGRLLGGCNQGCGTTADGEGCATTGPTGFSCFGGRLFGGHAHGGHCSLRQTSGRHFSRRLFNFPQAAGCGSGAYGLPTSGDCGCGAPAEPTCAAAAPSDCGNGCGNACGCGSIFGIKHSCFRNDGHFFGCFSRHGHRWGSMFSGSEDCGSGLFAGSRQRHSFGSFGCGHCQNAVPAASATCGTDQVSVEQGTWTPAPVSAE